MRFVGCAASVQGFARSKLELAEFWRQIAEHLTYVNTSFVCRCEQCRICSKLALTLEFVLAKSPFSLVLLECELQGIVHIFLSSGGSPK